MGTLYLVSTPIGNLEDITMRALRVLREVALIAAEDTRHTAKLLHHYEIATPCISYHHHNRYTRVDRILATLANGDVALVSDAGTPGVSDPGFELVQACIAAEIHVSPIPGANAPLAALVASGLATDQFFYLGFLPRRKKERRELFSTVAPITATLICFESPHRLIESLNDALAVLGNRQIVVTRELTKRYEEFIRAPMSDVLHHFATHPPIGEFTLVIDGYQQGIEGEQATRIDTPDEATIMQQLAELRDQGHTGSSAARMVAKSLGLQRRAVYQLWLKMQNEDDM